MMHPHLYSITIPLLLLSMLILFGVEGANPDIVRDCYSRALRAVVEKGLDVHDCVEHTEGLELLGLLVSGDGRGHISNCRRWRLWLAIGHLLSRGFCKEHDLEVIMGHFTAIALIHREGLAFSGRVYFCFTSSAQV